MVAIPKDELKVFIVKAKRKTKQNFKSNLYKKK